MEITSIYFGLSSIIAIFIYYLLNHKYQVIFLIVLSGAFVASFSYLLLIYIVVYAGINYFIALRIPSSQYKKALFKTGIIFNLLQLILLKYSTFAVDPIFKLFHSDFLISIIPKVIIPLGISYLTLQGIGYLINIKMNWEKPERNFMYFFLYLIFYPKFLSGPIERSNHLLPQIRSSHAFDKQNVVDGLRIALFGLFKKIAIANQMAPFIINTYANLDNVDGTYLFVLIIIQPLYLYFDFSGYTDIAIGFARSFGFNLLPNFNMPFFSENVSTFWKRFHISLSSWFNDYIFKQASFKYRKWGVYASICGLFITWILFGIWHGAGWNFMFLGFLQALAIIYEFFTKKWRATLFSRIPEQIGIWVGRLITYFFYGLSLVFFFAPDLPTALSLFSGLVDTNESILLVAYLNVPLSAYVFATILLLIELLNNDYNFAFKRIYNSWTSVSRRAKIFRWMIYSSILAILFVLGTKVQHFIYAQF